MSKHSEDCVFSPCYKFLHGWVPRYVSRKGTVTSRLTHHRPKPIRHLPTQPNPDTQPNAAYQDQTYNQGPRWRISPVVQCIYTIMSINNDLTSHYLHYATFWSQYFCEPWVDTQRATPTHTEQIHGTDVRPFLSITTNATRTWPNKQHRVKEKQGPIKIFNSIPAHDTHEYLIQELFDHESFKTVNGTWQESISWG